MALLLVALGLARPAAHAAPPVTPAADPPDAEMLRDLDVLTSADYAREHEVARRAGLLERLRVIETLRLLEEGAPPRAATGSGSSGRDTR
jgi:hypothetical protein